ncbi:MAG: TOBE domain-containing protein, partial [Proteobacteria bacterium]|nr:TOBE domain-containing protein [Pseudomonadota bacterium]
SLRFVEGAGAFELPVPAHLQKPLSRASKRPVFVGIRPEHVALKGGTSARGKTAPVRATVEVVEPMGNEIFLYCVTQKGGKQFVARIGTAKAPSVGQTVDLVFDLTNLHLFDAETEKRIG